MDIQNFWHVMFRYGHIDETFECVSSVCVGWKKKKKNYLKISYMYIYKNGFIIFIYKPRNVSKNK